MAKYEILYWQNLPSLIDASDDNGHHKIELSLRFQALIDHVAMETGLAGTDAYLEEWTRGDPEERDGSAEEVAKAVAGEFEAQFEDIKAAATAKK
jgi:hypothetical protein